MTVVTVTGGTGGPGATTLAVGLAGAWAALGDQTVLLVDLDPAGGDVAAHLTAVDLRQGLLPLASLAGPDLDAAQIAAECLQVAPQLWALAGLPRPDVSGLLSSELLRGLMAGCRTLADVVVVDAGRLLPTSPALHLVLEADVTVVAVRPHLPGALAARRGLDTLGDLAVKGELHLVAVAAPRRGKDVGELARALRRPVTGAIPADPRGVRRALRAGRPPQRGQATRAYAKVAGQLLDRPVNHAPAEAARRGPATRDDHPNAQERAPPPPPGAELIERRGSALLNALA